MARKPKKHTCKACDRLWGQIIRLSETCAVCGARVGDGRCHQVHAHHLIDRRAMFYRHNLENGICLCPTCHQFNFGQIVDGKRQISAHMTPAFFHEWLQENRPEQFEWFEKNRYHVLPGLKINYDEVYSALEDELRRRMRRKAISRLEILVAVTAAMLSVVL